MGRLLDWFPYLLAPLWLVGLALAASRLARLRRAAARGLLVLSIALVAWAYAARGGRDREGPILDALRRGAAALAACGILFARRRGRGLLEPAATVSAQALLGATYAVALVVPEVIEWADQGRTPWAILRALPVRVPWAFWVAVLALVAAAAPGYSPGQSRRKPVPSNALRPLGSADGNRCP